MRKQDYHATTALVVTPPRTCIKAPTGLLACVLCPCVGASRRVAGWLAEQAGHASICRACLFSANGRRWLRRSSPPSRMGCACHGCQPLLAWKRRCRRAPLSAALSSYPGRYPTTARLVGSGREEQAGAHGRPAAGGYGRLHVGHELRCSRGRRLCQHHPQTRADTPGLLPIGPSPRKSEYDGRGDRLFWRRRCDRLGRVRSGRLWVVGAVVVMLLLLVVVIYEWSSPGCWPRRRGVSVARGFSMDDLVVWLATMQPQSVGGRHGHVRATMIECERVVARVE